MFRGGETKEHRHVGVVELCAIGSTERRSGDDHGLRQVGLHSATSGMHRGPEAHSWNTSARRIGPLNRAALQAHSGGLVESGQEAAIFLGVCRALPEDSRSACNCIASHSKGSVAS
ncbi:hypothetical protein AAFF_G00263350 [Aldrovandia affinis]|uniref:Uncharacterized protein n=1 Tax=Aldrovandia affinis TaxID=143900 RepID=A0AAD7SSM6_9TELE|nr:hypothetical protein AAFF_G00263350 [Aldrovandia affinis]